MRPWGIEMQRSQEIDQNICTFQNNLTNHEGKNEAAHQQSLSTDRWMVKWPKHTVSTLTMNKQAAFL